MKKKLKDLKVGDKVWLYDFTDTTPIVVEKKKREGAMMTITLKWDESEYECVGHALGWTCIGYNRKWQQEQMFTSSFDLAWSRMMKRQAIMTVGKKMKEVSCDIEKTFSDCP